MGTKFGNYVLRDITEIGKGAFGTVYAWFRKGEAYKLYAGKKVRKKELSHQELTNLRGCNHVNIVSYVDFERNGSEVLLVTELMDSTLCKGLRPGENSLFGQRRCGGGAVLTKSRFDPPLTLQEVKRILSDCFAGLAYLRSVNVMHRDISSSNIFLKVSLGYLGRTIVAKFGDFGLAKFFDKEQRQPTTILLNTFFSALEADGTDEYCGFAADIYSMGVVLVECMMVLTNKWAAISQQYDAQCHFEDVRAICLNGSLWPTKDRRSCSSLE